MAAVLNRRRDHWSGSENLSSNYGEFYEQRHFASGLGCLEYVDVEGKRVPFGTDILFICEEEPELAAWQRSVRVTMGPCRQVLHAQAGANRS